MIETLPRFPCSLSKKPLTGRGFYDARSNCDDTDFPLVGVPTGSVSGLDVLDVDVAGLDWLKSHRLPETRVHETRSGGRHLFFKHCDGLRNSAGRIAKGIDVRADGGYVIWWPRNGYRVLSDAEMVEWPGWLLGIAMGSVLEAPGGSVDGTGSECMDGERVHGASRTKFEPTINVSARCKVILRKVRQAEVGTRNKLLNWASYQFGQMIVEGVLKPEAATILLEGAAMVCGLWRDDGAQQCRLTIKSGIAAGIRDARDKPPM